MLLAYPSTFRHEYCREMMLLFRTRAREVMQHEDRWQLLRFVWCVICDWLKTTIQEGGSMVSSTHALRWLAALPVAVVAAIAAARIVVWFPAMYLGLFNRFEHVGVSITIACFAMAATFVSVGVWVVPGRKDSVARIALGVVAVGGTLFIAVSAISMALAPLVWGISILLGGGVSYLSCRRDHPVLA